jgi:hypothetical protein
MKDILAGVRCWHAMMRSPSFSRSGESRTTRKDPAAVEVYVSRDQKMKKLHVPIAATQSSMGSNAETPLPLWMPLVAGAAFELVMMIEMAVCRRSALEEVT